MSKKKRKGPSRVRLGNARIIWRSGPEMSTVDGKIRETLCFKLPASAHGVGSLWTGDEVLHTHDDELDERRATFLLAGGGRATFQRRFYGGRQVGAQLILRDALASDDYFAEVLYGR